MGAVSDSMVGLAISQSLILTGMVQHGMRQLAEAVSQMTCVERVTEYSKLEKEGPIETPEGRDTKVIKNVIIYMHISDKKLEEGWPREGEIHFHNLSLFYFPTDLPVLKNLNIVIEHGEKVSPLVNTIL